MRRCVQGLAVIALMSVGMTGCGGGSDGGSDGGSSGNSGGGGIDRAALLGVWGPAEGDTMALHLFADGTYVVEDDPTPMDSGPELDQPVFVDGTYEITGDTLILRARGATDAAGSPVAGVDTCWVFGGYSDEVRLTGLYVKDGAQTAELRLAPGWSVTYDSPTSCGADNLPTNEDVLFGAKWNDDPNVYMYK